MNEYYTYAYLREDRTPYYIGKGKGYRAYQKRRTINLPSRDKIIILKKNLTEEEAFRHEIYMISIFGRKNNNTGILRNLTDGGEGTSGADNSKEKNGFYRKSHTDETKLKISKSKKGTKFPDELKPKVSQRTKEMWKTGVFSTKEYRETLSQSLCKRQYKITNKSGEVYYTNNIVKFAKDFNIDFSPLYKIAKGNLKYYKEWISVEVL
jgi:hypothetical protein